MHPIIAGIISGAVMGLGFDILTIMALQRLRGDDAPPWLQAVLRQTSFFKLVAPMAFFTHAAWTFAGLVAGAIYAASTTAQRAVWAAPSSGSPSSCLPSPSSTS